MGDKKHLGRFTVQFNLGDPQQARTAEILEQQGRQKARFISTAVLHYINCSETPEVVLPQRRMRRRSRKSSWLYSKSTPQRMVFPLRHIAPNHRKR